MAKRIRVVETIIDDIDGTEQPEGEGKSFTYVWNGRVYEIDLGLSNAAAVEEMMSTLTGHSRRIGSVPRALLTGDGKPQRTVSQRTDGPAALPAGNDGPESPSARTMLAPEGKSFTQLQKENREKRREIRKWARANGFPEQSDAGQITQPVVDAWNAAHPDDPVPEYEGRGPGK